jgi:hypothetical protein
MTLKRFVVGKGSNGLTWKWKGDVTPLADFGTPTTTTSYDFCVYDESGGTPTLVMSLTAPPGGTCGGKPCWKASSTGFQYKDSTLANDGLAAVKMKAGSVPGKSQFQVKGKKANLPVPTLPFTQDPAVTVQVRNSNGACWTTLFSAPAIKNLPAQFKDKTD